MDDSWISRFEGFLNFLSYLIKFIYILSILLSCLILILGIEYLKDKIQIKLAIWSIIDSIINLLYLFYRYKQYLTSEDYIGFTTSLSKINLIFSQLSFLICNILYYTSVRESYLYDVIFINLIIHYIMYIVVFLVFKITKICIEIISNNITNDLTLRETVIFDPSTLPTYLYGRKKAHLKYSNICVICTNNINNEEAIRILGCQHYFHLACVDPWLKVKAKCPTCRVNINLNILNNNEHIIEIELPIEV
jgi:hypothetical protein